MEADTMPGEIDVRGCGVVVQGGGGGVVEPGKNIPPLSVLCALLEINWRRKFPAKILGQISHKDHGCDRISKIRGGGGAGGAKQIPLWEEI